MDFDFITETIMPDVTSILTIGGTGSLEVPEGTTAQRPANGTAQIRYNTSNGTLEFYDTAWEAVASQAYVAAGFQPLNSNLTALAGIASTGLYVITGSGTSATASIVGTTNQITITNGSGVAGNPTVAISSTYAGQTSIVTVGTITTGVWNGTAVTAAYGGTGTTTTPTAGQVLVGTSANAYVPYTLASGAGISTTIGSGTLQINNTGILSVTGTANQITASTTAGATTVSLPAAVTITTSLTVSGLTANSFLYSGTAGLLTTTTAPTNGQLLIGSTGVAPVATTLTAGTGITITNAAGSITIAQTGGSDVTSITGTANQINASAATGAVTLSLSSTLVAPGSVTVTTGLYQSTVSGISAAGTTQGTATALTASVNVVTSVTGTQGVALPTPATAGWEVTVINRGAIAVLVYPAVGGTIDGNAINTSFLLPTNQEVTFVSTSTTQWYTKVPALSSGAGITITGTTGNATLTIANSGVTSFSAGTTGLTPTGSATGAVTLAGTLIPANGGTGVTTTPTNGQLLIGNGTNYTVAALTGTANQVTVTNGAGTITLSLPAAVTLTTSLTITGNTANSFLYSGTAGLLTTTAAPTNGQLLIGSTGAAPVLAALTGTANQVNVTNAAGSITLSISSTLVAPGSLQVTTSFQTSATNTITAAGTTQGTATVLTTDYNVVTTAAAGTGVELPAGLAGRRVTVVNRGANTLLVYPATGAAIDALAANTAVSVPSNEIFDVEAISATQWYTITLSTTTGGVTSITGTTNQITASAATGAVTLSLPASVTITTGLTVSGLTTNAFLYSGTAGLLTTTAAPTNGQLLIGSTGAAPGLAALTGTANQVTVTNGAGTITLSLPAAVTLTTSLTVSGNTANAFLYSGTAGLLTATAAPTNGQLLIGSTGAAPVLAALTGTANQVTVTNSAGGITLSLPASVTLTTGLTISGLTANSFLYSGTAGLLTTTAAPTNGELLIGSTGAAPVSATLTGTANQVAVTNAAGSITLSLPASVTITTGLTVSGLTANSFLYSGTAGLLTTTAAPTNGQLLIGSTGAAPVKANLTAGAGITVTNGAGTITIADTNSTVSSGLTATGTNQATALALTSGYNEVASVPAGTGVSLPAGAATGTTVVTICNRDTAFGTLNIYPATGGTIDGNTANTAIPLSALMQVTFFSTSTTQWYTQVNGFVSGAGISFTSLDGNANYQINNTGTTSVTGTANQINSSSTTGDTVLTLSSTLLAPGSVQVTTSLQTSAANTITAAGTTQGTATVLTTDYNVVTTAAANTGVVLPAGLAGRKVVVVNRGANAVNVYPATGAAIDGQAANAAYSVPSLSAYEVDAISATQWYTIGLNTTTGGVSSIAGTANQITASASSGAVTLSLSSPVVLPGFIYETTTAAATAAGTTQGTAYVITTQNVNFSTVAAGTGAILPTPTTLGLVINIVNNGANALLLYPNTGGSIDGQAANASISIPAGQVWQGLATSATVWQTESNAFYMGTGISIVAASGGVTITNTGVTSIAGTTNQITASAATGAVTLSLAEPHSAIVGASAAISTTSTYISAAFPIGAATIAAGDVFRITVFGTCTTTTANTSTMVVRFGTAGTIADTAIQSAAVVAGTTGTAIAFVWTFLITFRTATSAISSSYLVSTGQTGISAAAQPVVAIGTVVTGLTAAAAFLGVSFSANGTAGQTASTFQQAIVERVR